MTKYDKELAKKIRMEVGVAIDEPNPSQIEAIKSDLKLICDSGREPTREEWHIIVRKYCRKGPLLLLDSVDNSDLNTILMMALNATPKNRA